MQSPKRGVWKQRAAPATDWYRLSRNASNITLNVTCRLTHQAEGTVGGRSPRWPAQVANLLRGPSTSWQQMLLPCIPKSWWTSSWVTQIVNDVCYFCCSDPPSHQFPQLRGLPVPLPTSLWSLCLQEELMRFVTGGISPQLLVTNSGITRCILV